jgi:hypothetical protein
LENQGYTVIWRSAAQKARMTKFEGWEYVIHEHKGTQYRLKMRDNPVIGGYPVLLKKKFSAH